MKEQGGRGRGCFSMPTYSTHTLYPCPLRGSQVHKLTVPQMIRTRGNWNTPSKNVTVCHMEILLCHNIFTHITPDLTVMESSLL